MKKTESNMATISHPSETVSDQAEAQIIIIFSVWQFIIIVLTLGIGIVAVGRIVRVGCKNCSTIIIYLLCGLLHELYAIYILQTAKHISDTITIKSQRCADFYSVCLVAIVVSMLAVFRSTLKVTFPIQKANVFRNIALIYMTVVLPLLIKFKSLGLTKDNGQVPALQLETELLYVTVCERDPYDDGFVTLLEYSTLYIPFVCLYWKLYRAQKSKSIDQEMKFSELQCLPPCREGDIPYLCRTCIRVNPVLAVTLVYYLFSLLVARPFYIACSIVFGTMYKDLLPNITITALCTFVSIYCTFDIHLFPKKSTLVIRDGVAEVLVEPDNVYKMDTKTQKLTDV
ncbi:uncharacterized protein LOC132549863 [Ylistrum balloti]|uniref:uncharacterized protein LOC132549863 n=1 Tax=Ylistrum balloti TaxID=509963 RepID=UPI002905A1C1|nr:uncharacterized protein LOC132549863 [Ylistrum balloti]